MDITCVLLLDEIKRLFLHFLAKSFRSILPVDTLYRAHLHRLFYEVFRTAFRFNDFRFIRLIIKFENFGADLLTRLTPDAFFFFDIDFFTHLLRSYLKNAK